MSHHFTSNTESTTQWCNVCRCVTVWSVSGKRIGRCTEHGPKGMTLKQRQQLAQQKEQREAERQGQLFPVDSANKLV